MIYFFGQSPAPETGVLTFLVLLWAFLAVGYIWRRIRPRKKSMDAKIVVVDPQADFILNADLPKEDFRWIVDDLDGSPDYVPSFETREEAEKYIARMQNLQRLEGLLQDVDALYIQQTISTQDSHVSINQKHPSWFRKLMEEE